MKLTDQLSVPADISGKERLLENLVTVIAILAFGNGLSMIVYMTSIKRRFCSYTLETAVSDLMLLQFKGKPQGSVELAVINHSYKIALTSRQHLPLLLRGDSFEHFLHQTAFPRRYTCLLFAFPTPPPISVHVSPCSPILRLYVLKSS